jgi:excisionase family DNA binding protein
MVSARTATKTRPERPVYLSLQTAAQLHDVSVKTIRRRIADGTLPAYRVGQQLRVREADLARLAVRVPTVAGA